jgi:perosamine synthetase
MTQLDRIPVASPWITDHEIRAVTEAAATAWRDRANHYQSRFEAALAGYCGRAHGISLPSCTAGLHLALAASGIGAGDEVIVPDITWIATSAPVAYVGATPVFADVDRESWCLTPQSVEAVLTPRTRAIIAVDLYGDLPEWPEIESLAAERNIVLIEDAAEAVGARHGGRRAGSFGNASAFSFHGSKTLTTGEGGMLLVDDPKLLDRCLRLRDHGRRPGDLMFQNEEVGFKYRMSGLQAALGLAQLDRVDELVARKRAIFGWYQELLGDAPGIVLNRSTAGVENGYWMITVILDPSLGWTKEALIPAIKSAGVDVRPFFYPLSQLAAYRDTESGRTAAVRNRTAYETSPYGINLPSGPDLDRASVERVASTLRRLVASRPTTHAAA